MNQAPPRNWRDYLALMGKGLAMGAADVVPGVSGGTIAFISGIYDELLWSLGRLHPRLLGILINQGWRAAWREANAGFLLALFTGVLLSIKTFAAVIGQALEQAPILVWALFTGLIAASLCLFMREFRAFRAPQVAWFILGIAVVVGLSEMAPTQLPADPWLLFMGGFIAICAMILPGISGSFILLLLGLYPVFLNAINELQWVMLASFGFGCIAGLLLFSRALTWLLRRHYISTLALLLGFLVGSIKVTWPWKQTVVTIVDRHGEVLPLIQKNLTPWEYAEVMNQSARVPEALASFALGAALVLLTSYWQKRMERQLVNSGA